MLIQVVDGRRVPARGMLGYTHAHTHDRVISHVGITCSVCARVNVAIVCAVCVFRSVCVACVCELTTLCLQGSGCAFLGGVVSVPVRVF